MVDVTKELLEQIVKESKQYSDVLRKLNWKESGGNRNKLKSLLNIYNIDISHFVRYSFIELECPNCKTKFILNRRYYERRKLKGQKTFSCSQICVYRVTGNLSSQFQKGKPKSPSQSLKLSENAKINPNYGMRGKHHKLSSIEKIIKGLTGKILSQETCEKIRQAQLGDKHWNYQGRITPINEQIRHCDEYYNWQGQVFNRDNFTCQECGIKRTYLNAHHIKEFNIIMKQNNITTLEQALSCSELWDINNGITLCKLCHNKTKGRNNKK